MAARSTAVSRAAGMSKRSKWKIKGMFKQRMVASKALSRRVGNGNDGRWDAQLHGAERRNGAVYIPSGPPYADSK